MDVTESKQVEWRDNRQLGDSTSEEGETEVSSEVEVEAGKLLCEEGPELQAHKVDAELVANWPHCDVAIEGDAISTSREEATELALGEEWANSPFWALLGARYELW